MYHRSCLYYVLRYIINCQEFFSFIRLSFLFFLFQFYILTEDLVKLCSLKFSSLLFEIVYGIGKLRKQFKFFTKFAKNLKFNSDFHLWKILDKFLMEKPTPPHRNLVIFSKKMVTKNNDFISKNHQKVQKYWKSKNGIKPALRPLFKELWAN